MDITTFDKEGEEMKEEHDKATLSVQRSVSKRALAAAQNAAKGLQSADRMNVPGTRFLIVREGSAAENELSALPEEHLRMFTGEGSGPQGESIKFVAFTQ